MSTFVTSDTNVNGYCEKTIVNSTSERGLELIKSMEGLRLKSYICDGGQVTIGYGNTTSRLKEITIEQADSLLKIDIKTFENHLNSFEIDLSQSQYDALISFMFNLGINKFDKSEIINTLDDATFDRYIYSKGKKLNGLIKRRNDEKLLFNSVDINSGVNNRVLCRSIKQNN